MPSRWLYWFLSGLTAMSVSASYYGAVGPLQQSTGAPAVPVSTHATILNQYCAGCHNDKLKTAGLALNAIDVEDVSKNVEVWEKVVRKLRARAIEPNTRMRFAICSRSRWRSRPFCRATIQAMASTILLSENYLRRLWSDTCRLLRRSAVWPSALPFVLPAAP